MNIRLLFITRAYPPSVGGMEQVSYNLAQALKEELPVEIIAYGGKRIGLLWFLPQAFFLALWKISRHGITHIHLGDAVLSPIGLALKILTRKKVSVTVHGLDVTYKNPLYRAVNLPSLRHLDNIICVSKHTLEQCTQRGVPASKCTVIPWGVDPQEFRVTASREDLEGITDMNLSNKKVLLTVGRLVKRKGVAWFIDQVMPILGPEYVYLIVGEGPERPAIEATITNHGLHDRVRLLGQLPDRERTVLYNTSDIFIMPNIPLPGDMEGFGTVAIEASVAGMPVVGSNLEGVKDAVIDGETGWLASPQSPADYIMCIGKARDTNRLRVARITEQKFNWRATAIAYRKTLEHSCA
ncbi:MAG: glycosyl transferase group 1 [Patescibacteria group bacterium]|nr:glycosyl transferase group 1 [Patescibacteria group bacterium]